MRRAGTYSIVARDADTLELGVAVQSHWFSVGSVVPWVRAGVGAVAMQSIPVPGGGPRLLDLLAGMDAHDALRMLVAGDEGRDVRQFGLVDARGEATAHTGAMCVAHAGDVSGPGYTCQANMMATPDVWGAMAAGYESAAGSLAERLVQALEAGEAAGGDVRGRQSAAVVVVPPEGEAHVRSVDLRVEDHPNPVRELWRLLVLHRAYSIAGAADELVAEGRHAEAADRYERAAEIAPDNDELLFWAGLAAFQQGEREAGLERVRRAMDANPGWRELLPRLPVELAPGAPAVRQALGL
ncbi:MAG TPA: DUF1028 domain-containing protein [Solirubrobacteraceae bacterium]